MPGNAEIVPVPYVRAVTTRPWISRTMDKKMKTLIAIILLGLMGSISWSAVNSVTNRVSVVAISNPPYKGTGHLRNMSRQLDNRVKIKIVSTNRVVTTCSCGGCKWAFHTVTFHTNLTATLQINGITNIVRVGTPLLVDNQQFNIFDIQPYWGRVVITSTDGKKINLQAPKQRPSSIKYKKNEDATSPFVQ